ncbi:MAG: vWA domain-containing protein [Ktedonobacterales bacterium]
MSNEKQPNGQSGQRGTAQGAEMMLEPRQERRMIAHGGCTRHVDFFVHVGEMPAAVEADRTPLMVALVLDRSGSMSGEKLRTAKKAALALLDRLTERDAASVVVFDDHIDVVQAVGKVTPVLKAHVRAELARIEARASTALHEGWLTGCNALAEAPGAGSGTSLTRCFLLTDGLANVGISDPEAIAAEAANVREHTGIGTSTFGVGEDYSEELLGPMAVAGGGQFHHLRTASEIGTTFVRELGEMLAVAAANVRLELEVSAHPAVDLLSAYRATQDAATSRWTVMLGDLLSKEERHVVVRVIFPPRPDATEPETLRARLVWTVKGEEMSTEWREVVFTYADAAACDAEPFDPTVMHWVGQHLSDRAQVRSVILSKGGARAPALAEIREAISQVSTYVAESPELREELRELEELATQIEQDSLDAGRSKERYFRSQTRSAGKRDLRGE